MDLSESFILWSGGKDSYLSYKKALLRGFRVKYALSYIDENSRRLIGCHVRESVIREQVKRLGLEFIPVYGSKREGNFGKRLFNVLKDLPVRAGVFGDIYLREHRNFLESICSRLGLRAVFPLWHMSEEVLRKEVLLSMEALVVCRRVRRLPPKFLGETLSKEVFDYLSRKGMSLTGERGEYQTLVVRSEEIYLHIRPVRKMRRSSYECIDVEVME